MGTGVAEGDRLLNERLQAVEWRKQELPALPAHVAGGSWLIIGASDTTDLFAS